MRFLLIKGNKIENHEKYDFSGFFITEMYYRNTVFRRQVYLKWINSIPINNSSWKVIFTEIEVGISHLFLFTKSNLNHELILDIKILYDFVSRLAWCLSEQFSPKCICSILSKILYYSYDSKTMNNLFLLKLLIVAFYCTVQVSQYMFDLLYNFIITN